jgi:hypothetical protein
MQTLISINHSQNGPRVRLRRADVEPALFVMRPYLCGPVYSTLPERGRPASRQWPFRASARRFKGVPGQAPSFFGAPNKGGVASMRDAINLIDLVPRLEFLDVACRGCTRRGRLSVSNLIAQHGVEMTLPALRDVVAGDCSRQGRASVYEQCGVYFPGLADVFRSKGAG